MVRNLVQVIVALALLAAVVVGLWLLFPSEEKKIRKQLHGLAELASFTGQEGNLKRLTTASALANRFTLDAQIHVQIPGLGVRTFSGRSEIQETALAALAQGWAAKVEFHDLQVTMASDKMAATVDLTATVNTDNQRSNLGLQELRFQMRKTDSGWLIQRVETMQTFR